jgi:hypothetical protein
MSKLQQVVIKNLRPTQLTVGMLEVADKKARLAALSEKDQADFMAAHPMPVVLGPDAKLFITDHHHLARAALEARVVNGFYTVEADLSDHKPDDFWKEMDKNLWVHPLDQNGIRHHYPAIPGGLDALVDDVYRSLAGYVRDGGGYEKTHTAFAEFVWADFFRRNIAIEDVTANFHAAVPVACRLAKSALAKGIPGYKEK